MQSNSNNDDSYIIHSILTFVSIVIIVGSSLIFTWFGERIPSGLQTSDTGKPLLDINPFVEDNKSVLDYKAVYEKEKHVHYDKPDCLPQVNKRISRFIIVIQTFNKLNFYLDTDSESFPDFNRLPLEFEKYSFETQIEIIIKAHSEQSMKVIELFKEIHNANNNDINVLKLKFTENTIGNIQLQYKTLQLIKFLIEHYWYKLENRVVFSRLLFILNTFWNGLHDLATIHIYSSDLAKEVINTHEAKTSILLLTKYSSISNGIKSIILYILLQEKELQINNEDIYKSRSYTNLTKKFENKQVDIDLIIGRIYQIDELLNFAGDFEADSWVTIKLGDINERLSDLLESKSDNS